MHPEKNKHTEEDIPKMIGAMAVLTTSAVIGLIAAITISTQLVRKVLVNSKERGAEFRQAFQRSK